MRTVNSGIPLVRTNCIHKLGELFKDSDINVHTLIRSVKAPLDIQKCECEFLPETTILNLVKVFGQSCSPETFVTTIWLLCKNIYIPSVLLKLNNNGTGTVREALEEFCRVVKQYSSGASISLEWFSDHYWLIRDKDGVTEDWYKYAEVFSIIFLEELVSALTNYHVKASYAAIRSPDMDHFFNCSKLSHIQFFTLRSVTGIRLDESTLKQKTHVRVGVQKANVANFKEIPDNFVSSFKLSLEPYLTMGKLPISDASSILGIHSRTIQRRLNEAGMTYSDIVDELVLKRTLELLKYSQLSITTIASNIGYGDSANFTRFFKRKMAMTPSQYRRQSWRT